MKLSDLAAEFVRALLNLIVNWLEDNFSNSDNSDFVSYTDKTFI